ncbi:LPXTG cell wall anchor domain-containing protein [Streptomyces sp. NPDC049813]|uniref:LPXTG cell wall anchor domain-containing protein n=1 Tax=Streptomyces sp. NPDC049813 TaxID=3365597 RepID=UPI0037998EB3
MKLHRVLATAAVTAVIGPVALFAAPVAVAAEEPSGSPSATASPTATASPGDAGSSASAEATGEATGKATGEASASATATRSAAAGARSEAEPTPTYTRPTFCSGIPDEERGKTSLQGLPSKIVAGSGWHDFRYRVTNVSEVKVMETVVSLYLGTADPHLDDIAELAVTVQWFDETAGTWKAIEGDGADVLGNSEFASVTTLAPGEYADAKMRVKVGTAAKAGTGYFFTIGHSYGEDGQCGFDDISQFDFTVLKAGSEPGAVDDAKGKPGKAEDAEAVHAGRGSGGDGTAPQGGLAKIPVSGRLASTGSSSALPAIAAAGGAAVLLGAGAVVVVRRRKGRPAA